MIGPIRVEELDVSRPIPTLRGLTPADLVTDFEPATSRSGPLVTVAVCTRDRTESLELSLESVERLDYPHLDIIVVDNASTDDSTHELVRSRHPRLRYVREDRPGLDWARNRAIAEACGQDSRTLDAHLRSSACSSCAWRQRHPLPSQ